MEKFSQIDVGQRSTDNRETNVKQQTGKKLGMPTHTYNPAQTQAWTFNPSTQKVNSDLFEFKASQGYIVKQSQNPKSRQRSSESKVNLAGLNKHRDGTVVSSMYPWKPTALATLWFLISKSHQVFLRLEYQDVCQE